MQGAENLGVGTARPKVLIVTELKLHRDFLEKTLQKKSEELSEMEREYLNLFYRNREPVDRSSQMHSCGNPTHTL